jgi:hypothetical protein
MSGNPLLPSRDAARTGGTASGGPTGAPGATEAAGKTAIFTCECANVFEKVQKNKEFYSFGSLFLCRD